MAAAARSVGLTPQALHQSCGSRAEFCQVVVDILSARWCDWLSAQFVERVAVLPRTDDEIERVLIWQAVVEFGEGEVRAGHRGLAEVLVRTDQFEHDELFRRIHIATGAPPSELGARVAVATVRGLRREIVAGRLPHRSAELAFNAALARGAFQLIDVNQLQTPA